MKKDLNREWDQKLRDAVERAKEREQKEAEKVLNQYGFVVKSSLTKDCTHLINESGIESAKTQTARDRGVIIITNVKQLLEEN